VWEGEVCGRERGGGRERCVGGSRSRAGCSLREVDLEYLLDRKGALTDPETNWEDVLSLGEKQR
jgi:hypothetical protein